METPDALSALAELFRALDSEDDARIERAWATARRAVDERRDETTEPTSLPGDIAGPGGAYDEGAVVFDGRNAVLHDETMVARIDHPPEGVEFAFGLLLGGKVNKREERAKVLFFTPLDGVADIIVQLHAVAARAGCDVQLAALCEEKWRVIPRG